MTKHSDKSGQATDNTLISKWHVALFTRLTAERVYLQRHYQYDTKCFTRCLGERGKGGRNVTIARGAL
jgi:hypothetical protein